MTAYLASREEVANNLAALREQVKDRNALARELADTRDELADAKAAAGVFGEILSVLRDIHNALDRDPVTVHVAFHGDLGKLKDDEVKQAIRRAIQAGTR